MRKCKRCGGIFDLSNFYWTRKNKHTGKIYYRWECKACFNKYIHNDYQKKRRLENKSKFIEMLGGKCIHCGYKRNIYALEFHHLDKNSKEFEVSSMFQRVSNDEKIRKELEKCILVCANCHREIHNPV